MEQRGDFLHFLEGFHMLLDFKVGLFLDYLQSYAILFLQRTRGTSVSPEDDPQGLCRKVRGTVGEAGRPRIQAATCEAQLTALSFALPCPEIPQSFAADAMVLSRWRLPRIVCSVLGGPRLRLWKDLPCPVLCCCTPYSISLPLLLALLLANMAKPGVSPHRGNVELCLVSQIVSEGNLHAAI